MIKILPLTPDLVPGAVELVMALVKEEGWQNASPGALALSLMASQFPHVAVVRDEVVGILDARLSCDAVTGEHLEFCRFYVMPAYRKKGVGHRLLRETVAAIPDEWGDLPIYISTVGPLRRSFRRLGFQTICLVHGSPLSRVREAMGK